MIAAMIEQDKSDGYLVSDISKEMAIDSYDIVSTLQALGMMKYWKGKHIILKKQVSIPFANPQITEIRLGIKRCRAPRRRRKERGISHRSDMDREKWRFVARLYRKYRAYLINARKGRSDFAIARDYSGPGARPRG